MRSLRARLLATTLAAVLVATVLTVLVGGLLVRSRVQSLVLANLGRQADAVARVLDRRSGAAPALALVAFFARQDEFLGVPGGSLPRLRQAVLSAVGDRTSGRVDVGRRELFFVVRTTTRGPIVLARPNRLGADDWRPFLWVLVLAGGGGAVVAAGLSFLLVRRITRPIREVASASGRLAAGESGVRVPVQGSDELAGLASSFNVMADRLSEAKDRERAFLQSVSHELKTPLTAIRGYAEAIREEAVRPQEAASVIGAEAVRLERLVRDLLELARLDRREFEVSRGPVDLSVVAAEAVRRHAPEAREFGVELVVVPADAASGMGDEGRLLQVVSNLVENALRVTPAGGRVVVRAERGGLHVSDTGPGIAAEDLPNAFDRFFLYRKYGGDRQVGSGLGLTVVKELVEAMGGSVSVSSTEGVGTTFSVRLATG
jgi:two-component system sensor histidine kinase BaeS